MNSVERKKYIVEQIEAGRPQNHLAQELGVSRQAISALWKKYKERGQEVLLASGPGRFKEPDALTPAEVEEMGRWLHAHEPCELQIDEPDWTLYGVKRAVLVRLGKRVRLPLIYNFCLQVFGHELVPEQEETPETASLVADSGGMPTLEEMERSNRETIARMQAQGTSYAPRENTGRLGKRKKATSSPVAKKSRRKKR